MLKVRGLSKSFSGKKVISSFSSDFHDGIHKVEGPNGSGKSTLLMLIAGLLMRDEGEITFIDLNNKPHNFDVLKFGACAPDKPDFYQFALGKEYIDFVCSSSKVNLNKVESLIECFDLKEFLDVKFSDMSLGVKKKFFYQLHFLKNLMLFFWMSQRSV